MTDAFPPAPEPQGKGSRRLKYALIASLALNLLVVGAVGGVMYGFGKHPPRFGHGRGEDFGLLGLTRILPDDRKKELRKQLRQDREQLRPLMDEIGAARRAAADKLAAEPFDKPALEAAISDVAEKERALRQAAVGVFLSHAERLSPDERRMLADWWKKKSERMHRRHGKGKDAEKKGKAAEASTSP